MNAWLPDGIKVDGDLTLEPLPDRGEPAESGPVLGPWVSHEPRKTDVAAVHVEAPGPSSKADAHQDAAEEIWVCLEPVLLALSLVRRANVDCSDLTMSYGEARPAKHTAIHAMTGRSHGYEPMMIGPRDGCLWRERDCLERFLQTAAPIVRDDRNLLSALRMHADALRPAVIETAFLKHWLVIDQRLSCWAHAAGQRWLRLEGEWREATKSLEKEVGALRASGALDEKQASRLKFNIRDANRRPPKALLEAWIGERGHRLLKWQAPKNVVDARNALVHPDNGLGDRLARLLPHLRRLVRRLSEALLMEAVGYVPESRSFFSKEQDADMLWVPATGQ